MEFDMRKPNGPEYFEAKFWGQVNKQPGGCWLWLGLVKPNGYGSFYAGVWYPNKVYPHRYAYELMVGTIPEGLELDHLCGVRRCVNPEHLEPVTHRENLLRSGRTFAGRNSRKATCPRGHALAITDPETGHRRCVECHERGVPNGDKTHCKRGHPFNADNTYWFPDGSGRGCRTCRRATNARRAANVRGAR